MSGKHQPVIIGEVLFDLFEDGQAVLGGAPFNVAWHLHGFGLHPIFISRIGQDKYGEQIDSAMRQWGMDVRGMQIDTQHSTGMVKVRLEQGQPTFDICNDVAYDYIDVAGQDVLPADSTDTLLYHGSLAARSRRMFERILTLRQRAAMSFVDINLRAPWWDKERVQRLLQGAGWLKLNDDELMVLSGAGPELSELIAAAKDLRQANNIQHLIITRGAQGAMIIDRDNTLQSESVPVSELQDTVGAGDAFSAVCMLGIIHDWEHGVMLQRATEFAAKICQQRGASSANPSLYDNLKTQWQLT